MTKKQWQDELAKHAAAAKAKGWCEQCQRPWFDGTCSCGHSEEPEVKEAMELAFSAEGWLREPEAKKRKAKLIRPDIPCGQPSMEGEYCCEDKLCPSCAYILHLEGKLGIKPVKSAKTMKKLEKIWEL